jgi:ATP dependent DNA ligase domain
VPQSAAYGAFPSRSPGPIYALIMLLHPRTLPAGFIAPCLPIKAETLPSGGLWLHEIKHDGFRIIARKDGDRVRLYSRPGNDMTRRFPLIVASFPACVHSPASSMGKPSLAMRAGAHRSSVSATASTTRPSSCTLST